MKLIRETEFGELKIIIQNNVPIRVEEIKIYKTLIFY